MFSDLINNAVAILLLRTVTGILFFFQGYDKLFNVKIVNILRTYYEPISKLHFPASLVKFSVSISCLIELICGILLFFGLFKNITLFLLTGNMILVAFIFSWMKPMWDMQYYFPRLLFIFILLLSPSSADLFSLDYLISIVIK